MNMQVKSNEQLVFGFRFYMNLAWLNLAALLIVLFALFMLLVDSQNTALGFIIENWMGFLLVPVLSVSALRWRKRADLYRNEQMRRIGR